MAEQLQIQVQASVQQAINGLNNLNSQLNATAKTTELLGTKSVEILNNQLQRLQRLAANPNLSTEQYQRLATIINRTSKEADTLSKSIQILNRSNGQLVGGANQANTAMINLGRTVSDAPFGFIGIANNIGPLVENFVSLKKESGSTGGALKQLGASFLGPGGLIVGVQLVVAAIQFAQLGLSRWTGSTKKAKEEQDKLKQSTDQYVSSITKQRLEFETLVKIAKDASQSEIARTQALKKLNEILPDTIGNLTKQNIVTNQGTEIIKNYIKAVEAKATAELLSNRIAENNVKLFDNRNKVLKDSAKIDEEIRVLRTKLSKIDINATGRAGESAALRYLGIQNQINDLIQDQSELQAEGRKLAKQLIDDNILMRKEYERQIPVVNTLNDKKDKGSNKEKTLQEKINELLSDYKNTLQSISYEEQIRGINQSNQRLETNLDFLKRAADLVGFTGDAYKSINKDTKAFSEAAANQKIVDVIKAYQSTLSELDIKQAVTGQDQLNGRINAATDALIKLKTLGVQSTNEEFIKLQNTLNKLETEVGLKEIRKRTEEITKTWDRFQLQIDKLNFNQTKKPLDLLKSKIDLIGNAIQELKSKGLTDKDLGIGILSVQFEQLGLQFDKLKQRQEVLQSLQSALQTGIGGALDDVFEAFVKGENVFESLTNSVKELIVELAKAVIQTLILKAVSSAIGGAGGGAVSGIAGAFLRTDTIRTGIANR